MLSTNNFSKKSAAIYNSSKQYICTEDDPFIIRDQIKIPITSRYKEPNPERYGNTICDDYIEYIPKSKVFHKKIYPSFSKRDVVENFRVQSEQKISLNDNDNVFTKELPIYLCLNEYEGNKNPFQNEYKAIFQIEYQNETPSSFSCIISIRSIDIDMLFNYQYHITPYSYRSFINKHIIPNDIKELAMKNLYLSFKKYISYLKYMIESCIKTTCYKARIIIPDNSNNDLIKFVVSNNQEQFIFYDILSLYMFQSEWEKIYHDVNDDYIRTKKLNRIIKSQLVRFANSVSIHAPSIYIRELQNNNLSVNRDYYMKSKSYWMNILDNCFKECDDTKENKKDITNNVFKSSSDEIKLFNNNLNKLNDIVSKRKEEKIKLSFNNKYYNKNNNNGYYQNAEYLISSEYKFEYKIPIVILIGDKTSFHFLKKLTIQLKQKDDNYYLIVYDDDNVLFHCISEKFNEYILENMMDELHIKLVNNKENTNDFNLKDKIYNKKLFNTFKFSIQSIVKELLEKCENQNDRYQCYLFLSSKEKDIESINNENILTRVRSINLDKSTNNLNINLIDYNYGKIVILKSYSLKLQIIFLLKLNIFPKEILAESIKNRYYLLSEEINYYKYKVYSLIDAIKIFNKNIFKYVDLPSWSIDYAKGFNKKRIL